MEGRDILYGLGENILLDYQVLLACHEESTSSEKLLLSYGNKEVSQILCLWFNHKTYLVNSFTTEMVF